MCMLIVWGYNQYWLVLLQCFLVCTCSSDSASGFFICCKSHTLKHFYPFPDDIAIKNIFIYHNILMSCIFTVLLSESRYFLKMFLWLSLSVHFTDPYLLNGIPSRTLQYFISCPVWGHQNSRYQNVE